MRNFKQIFIGLFAFWVVAFIVGIWILPQYNRQIGAILVVSFIGMVIYVLVGVYRSFKE